jgi:chemotaxis protein methyltransferase CheR
VVLSETINLETYSINETELGELLNVLHSFGYDFTHYAKASFKRRVNRLMIIDRIPSFAELVFRLKHEGSYLKRVVQELTVNVTEMFRDPALFKTLRETVLPQLATNPFIRIWHAGCSTGEEVFSMAILLEEANLLHKSLLYATDLNPSVIENIRKGIFPMSQMKQYSENYILSGGKNEFSKYYTAKYDWAKFDDRLMSKMIASTHNLVSDSSFNEFQMIFCRNVLIYFDKDLQEKVLTLFEESLERLGFLVLGSKENLRFTSVAPMFRQPDKNEKIWRKMI